MIEPATVDRIIAETLGSRPADAGPVVATRVVERPFGWIVFWTHKRIAEGDPTAPPVGGNSPFVIDRRTGEVTYLGTAWEINEAIRRYARKCGLDPGAPI